MIERIAPYLISFFGALALTLVLTPLVREMNRRLGMVDKPDPRRINKIPVPRGGGLALMLGVTVSFGLLHIFWDGISFPGGDPVRYGRCAVLATTMALIGLADDKFSLPPKVKLLGQFVVALLTWWWGDLGFKDLWPSIPMWLDCILTVFWILGAVNAFNLIDGLDGLASGLALVATVGMGGALFCTGHASGVVFYFAFAGGLLGFLKYNYNPASVFLGDCGSMYIGYVLAALPLGSHAPNSFLVSVGVPLLAMGVPIFDTSLAIIRRSVRHLLNRDDDAKEGQVMTADVDHLHHRILRSANLNQRKAVWTLYGLATLLVTIGLVGLLLKDRAAGLWILAVVIVSAIIFRDMARIELFDTGRLLDTIAHARDTVSRRRWARLAVPFYVAFDLVVLAAIFIGVTIVLQKPLWERHVLMVALPIRVLTIFGFMALFRIYRTVWSRAMMSNYIRLLLACVGGSLVGTALIYYAPGISNEKLATGTILYALLPFLLISFVRVLRSIVRDMFYHLNCERLKGRKNVSRILVYGTGLRYRTFRRELVRDTTHNNERVIMGLIDDDLLLRDHYIGGLRVLGTLEHAPEIVNELNIDAVVVACEVSDEWKRIIRETLEPTGVKITYFNFGETDL